MQQVGDAGSIFMMVQWGGLAIAQTAENYLANLD
jgi:hypothetical protein